MKIKKTVKTAALEDVLDDIKDAFDGGKITLEEKEIFESNYLSLSEDYIRRLYGRKEIAIEQYNVLVNSHFQYRVRLRLISVDPLEVAKEVVYYILRKKMVDSLPIGTKEKLNVRTAEGGVIAIVNKRDDTTIELISIYY